MGGLEKKQHDPARTEKLRTTRQRRMILDELRKRNTHPTADVLYEKVRKRLPRISLGTVYRNLEILTAQGEIQTLEISGSQKRYDGVPQKHYHIRCLHCGSMDDAPIAPLNRLEDALYGATVYTILGHRLEFVGLCPACSKKEEVRRLVEQDLNLPTESSGP
ncbi:MAG: transcriptional repressor [Desulfobacteraceae bacterium]|nr:MAG: transcriptional repressor [Desulfobacteraceae bacterium]